MSDKSHEGWESLRHLTQLVPAAALCKSLEEMFAAYLIHTPEEDRPIDKSHHICLLIDFLKKIE